MITCSDFMLHYVMRTTCRLPGAHWHCVGDSCRRLLTSPRAIWSQETANLESSQCDDIEGVVQAALPNKKHTGFEFAVLKGASSDVNCASH